MASGGHVLCSLCAAVLLVVAFMGQASHGWVLGARASPFADLTPHNTNNLGPDEFRLTSASAGYAPSSSDSGALDHFSKRSSDYDPYSKRSGDEGAPIKLCGQYLDNLIRFVCRNYFNNHMRGRRSADDWTSIFSPEDYKIRSRSKRSAGASDLCCRRSCRRSELIQFC